MVALRVVLFVGTKRDERMEFFYKCDTVLFWTIYELCGSYFELIRFFP